MPQIKLSIISQPPEGTRSVIKSTVTPVIKGEGNFDYLCGNCNTTIVEKVHRGQIKNIVVCCPNCGQYNEFP